MLYRDFFEFIWYRIDITAKSKHMPKIAEFIFCKKPFIVCSIILLICWMPYLIAVFPGVLHYDALVAITYN